MLTPSETALRSTRVRAALAAVALFWTCTFGLLSVRGALLVEGVPFAVTAPRRAVVALFAALLCAATTLIIGRMRFRSFGGRMVWAVAAAVVMSVLLTGFHQFTYRVLLPVPGMKVGDGADWVFFWLGYFLAWTGTYLALLYHWEVQDQERRLAGMRDLAQEARLAALRSQINPHFLFNTLNSISSLVLDRNIAGAERMLQNLATFFRATLTSQASDSISLHEEVELQRLYLDIEAVRFSDRMRVDIRVPPDLGRARVPALILQPLVENAVRHAVGRSETVTTIRIEAGLEDRRLRLSVEDDGPARDADRGGSGVGLANVADRLHAQFGSRATLSAGRSPDGGFVARMLLPLELPG